MNMMVAGHVELVGIHREPFLRLTMLVAVEDVVPTKVWLLRMLYQQKIERGNIREVAPCNGTYSFGKAGRK